MRRLIILFRASITKILEFLYGAKSIDHTNFVLMFHDLGEKKTNPKEFYTNILEFKQYIIELNSNKKIVPIEDAINGKGIALTFDDCYSSVYELAYPILKQYRIPFTVFITTEYIDKTPYLTMHQLEELASDSLCTIGAHSLTHEGLRTAKDSWKEISVCKSVLEEIIKRPVLFFAYPYGSIEMCSMKNIVEAKRAGYKYAFSTIKGSIDTAFRIKFFLPRVNGDHLVRDYEEKKNETSHCGSWI